MVLNAAVQMLREADELKETISKFKSGTSMLQERSLWTTQQELQKIYQKVLVLDLDYALDKKVEQDLWNIGFKQQIEALQAISKDRKNPLRSEGQAMLSWVLQAAAGFYLCLLHQICTTFQLDLPFRRRASLLGWVEGWGAGEASGAARLPAASAARYICQHCLVHLGDLARYRQQMRVAHTFYRHALVVSVHSGQPYNQLALVSWRRARRLSAVYWHVRSLLVRAPFPPAPHNLARTLRAAAAAAGSEVKELPVLPGVTSSTTVPSTVTSRRLDAHSYVTELLRTLHYIHTGDELDTASSLVDMLNSSLITLVATDSFESMTLIKMVCVLIWAVHSTTEEFTLQAHTVTEGEARAAALACSLAAGALLALLLPSYMVDAPLDRALPAIKVFLEWSASQPAVLSEVWLRPALWPALAHTLNSLHQEHRDTYTTVPLPEDEELHGFLPLESYLQHLKFPNHAAWDTYAARVPTVTDNNNESPQEVATCVLEEPELQRRVRAHRLMLLGRRLADTRPDCFSYTVEEDRTRFTAASVGGEQLTSALAQLVSARGEGRSGGEGEGEGGSDSEEEAAPTPPRVISEADFREKVREKRAGILKPQGSLERAREERALLTQDEQHSSEESSDDGDRSDDKKENRKPRVNIAMAAIMRKQEETNKQVKFVTPPPTPESTTDSVESKEEKPKVIQPKVMKSLANIPIGRKTGGILSLKDKSGYPHLVNTDPEPKKEKEEKKEPKLSQSSQNYQQKKVETSPTWNQNVPTDAQPYSEGPRISFQKNYGIQNAGIIYNPNYQPSVNNQGIRLPVVNPKEIDVRTAALQKQSSRQDMFQEGKFNQNYQMSGDKKNFLNDLPPRFANQYRYWQAAQENQYNDNKFRDDNLKPNVNNTYNQPQSSWMNPPEYTPAQPPWWNQNYNAVKPNYFAPVNNNPPYQNPYPNTFNQVQKPEGPYPSTIGQPMQSLQNLVTSPNFNSLGNYTYPPPVQYDAAMYPQFNNMNNLGYRMPMKPAYHEKDMMDLGVGFGADMQKRNMNFNEQTDGTLEPTKVGEGITMEAPSNTYSLFSGAPTAGWGSAQNQPPQSLWSGPGPSPLERLLEQQKQGQPPPQ